MYWVVTVSKNNSGSFCNEFLLLENNFDSFCNEFLRFENNSGGLEFPRFRKMILVVFAISSRLRKKSGGFYNEFAQLGKYFWWFLYWVPTVGKIILVVMTIVMGSHGLENDSGGFCSEFPWLGKYFWWVFLRFPRVGLSADPKTPRSKTPQKRIFLKKNPYFFWWFCDSPD